MPYLTSTTITHTKLPVMHHQHHDLTTGSVSCGLSLQRQPGVSQHAADFNRDGSAKFRNSLSDKFCNATQESSNLMQHVPPYSTSETSTCARHQTIARMNLQVLSFNMPLRRRAALASRRIAVSSVLTSLLLISGLVVVTKAENIE